MSSTYNIEPPPTAKVLLQTSNGDIELEIFAKQTPLASRNFLQHCLDGYYNGTIFHRLVPGFVLQGGDPTGTGNGGESVYHDGPFVDEFHSRLKFNRRGLLGMANTGRKDDNGSQFFITLGKTENLNGKSTMFGRVVGDTIYNVVKMGESELIDVDGSERPLYPTEIVSAAVLLNPFTDMIRRQNQTQVVPETVKLIDRKRPRKKAGKVFLSFGDEDGENEAEPVKKVKFNTKLIVAENAAQRNPIESDNRAEEKPRNMHFEEEEHSAVYQSTMRLPVESKTQPPLPDKEEPKQKNLHSFESLHMRHTSSMLERTNAQIAELKASMKRSSTPSEQESRRKNSALENIIPANAIRGRKRNAPSRDKNSSDTRTLELLNKFRLKLDRAPREKMDQQTNQESQEEVRNSPNDKGQEADEGDLCDLHFIVNCQSCKAWDEGETSEREMKMPDMKGWMSHSLKFGKDRLGKDLNWRKNNEDSMVVIDPREKSEELARERADRTGQKEKGGVKGEGKANRARDLHKTREKDIQRERGRVNV